MGIFENQNKYMFAGSSIEKDKDLNFHSIYTDHPYMNQIGLSTFTMNDLASWLKRKSGEKYLNMEIFGVNPPNDIDWNSDDGKQLLADATFKLLGQPTYRSVKTTAWRTTGRGGNYIEYFLNDWKYFNRYNYTNLNFADFDNKKVLYTSAAINLIESNNLDKTISNIITMNDYVRCLEFMQESDYSDIDKARIEYILDIKTSKYKYLEWEGQVEFNLNLGVSTSEGDDKCIKTETVKYKLFLYDNKKPRGDSRKLALTNFTFVSNKVDQFDRIGNKEDGELDVPSIKQNPATAIAAELDLKFNEFTGKWESGTPQVLAVISTDIPAAVPLSLESIKSLDINEQLSPETQHQVVIGSAIPLVMQNGNPLQIAPDYRKPKGCRGSDTSKLEIRVYNRVPRVWKSGELVILNKIDGIWQPTSYGEPLPGDEPPSVLESKWSFTYLSTNSRFYFKSNQTPGETPKTITYKQYEDAVRECYYWDDDFNQSEEKEDLYLNAITENGYFQYTSWDFMGPAIGGLREFGNALACTQLNTRPDNQPLENGGIFIYGTHTAPFFGCVFPDGYVNDKYDFHKDLLLPVKSTPTTTPNFFFTSSIEEGTDIFTNNNVNIGDSNAGGMFVDQTDSTLKNLPADIALNASPSGINGSPIFDVKNFEILNPRYITNNLGEYYRLQVANLVKNSKHWLYIDNPLNPGDKNESLFDLAPINPGKIQFRPLKMEVYANFEVGSTGDKFNDDVRGYNGYTSWGIVNDLESPISQVAYYRNGGSSNLLVGVSGLKYNIDIINDGFDDTLPPRESNKPLPWFQQPWQEFDRPAGAVGIIAASCSILADNSISFDTFNYFGVRGYLVNNEWYPSFGGFGGNSYNNFQTTQLHVRVFHPWPKHLTLHDPRFFSVFHFNDGLNIYGSPTAIEYYFNGEKITEDAYNEADDSLKLYPSGYYIADKVESEVDIPVPTFYDNTQAPLGYYVTNDSPLRSPEHSALNISRRGKLLPYNYKYYGIGLDGDLSSIVVNQASSVVTVGDYDVVIFNPGVEYSPGDSFSVIGPSDLEEAILYPKDLDENYGILSFTVNPPPNIEDRVLPFKGLFLKEDFLNSDTLISSLRPGEGMPIVLKRRTNGYSGSRSGFVGMVVRGKVVEKESFDAKPTELGVLKLSPDPQAGSPRPDEIYKEVNQFYNVNFQIPETLKSEEGKYDLFFHFHNDISHTAMQDRTGRIVPQENQITLTINVD